MNTAADSPDNPKDPSDKPEPGFAEYQLQLPGVGQRIGSNRIIDLIAEGGMASVYKVWHEELEIVRAIKMLKPGFDEESKSRLRTEAKISAHLRHPNIVEIYGVQFWNDTVPYLEMEFVDGHSLKTILDNQRTLPLAAALALVSFVCNALHYAHQQVFTLYGKSYEGIVHRDIKPANILITQNGIPKLADFGIARPQDISLHTEGQKVLGTFTYLSPEQLEGQGLDRRSDIYSLGAVLYECLTGFKAFPQRSLTDLLREKLRNNYPSFASMGVDLPKQCEQIIDKCMQLDRNKRYATAEEIGKDLLDLFAKTTAETPEQVLASFCAGRDTKPARPRKTSRALQPLLLFSALIFGLALVALGVISGALKLKQSRQAEAASSRGLPAQSGAPALPAVQDTLLRSANFAVPETGKPSAPAAMVPAARRQQVMENPVKQERPWGQMAAAEAAVRAQRWQQAVSALEQANSSAITDSGRQDVRVMLLESYLGMHDLTNAKILVEHGAVNDGYFFLLAGETNLKLGRLSQAIDDFCKAQTTPSRYRRDLRKDATFLWSKALLDAYRAKPNSDNKHAALRAWQQFSSAFCGEPDHTGRCKEAEEGLRELQE